MSTWGQRRLNGAFGLTNLFSAIGVRRTSLLSAALSLVEVGGVTNSVVIGGREFADFPGNGGNRLNSNITVPVSSGTNSFWFGGKFYWRGFHGANNTCRIFKIGKCSFSVILTNGAFSVVDDPGVAINGQYGLVNLNAENDFQIYVDRLAGFARLYLNGVLAGSNALGAFGAAGSSLSLEVGDSAVNSRGDFAVGELHWGTGPNTVDVFPAAVRGAIAGATEFLDVSPIIHKTGGTATNALTFSTAIIGGRTGATYTVKLQKATTPALPFADVSTIATPTSNAAFEITDPAAGLLAYYRLSVDSTVPAVETFQSSNSNLNGSAPAEVGNCHPGAAPTLQALPVTPARTPGAPRVFHIPGDSRVPVGAIPAMVAAITGCDPSQVATVSRSGSNIRNWVPGVTTYPPGIDIYALFKADVLSKGGQPGDVWAWLLDVNSLEAADALGAGGYTDAWYTTMAAVVADGFIPWVIEDPYSASFPNSTFTNYATHRAVIIAALAAASPAAKYLDADGLGSNTRRMFNSNMAALSTDETHWNQPGALTILTQCIAADLIAGIEEPGGVPVSVPNFTLTLPGSYFDSPGGGVLYRDVPCTLTNNGNLAGTVTFTNISFPGDPTSDAYVSRIGDWTLPASGATKVATLRVLADSTPRSETLINFVATCNGFNNNLSVTVYNAEADNASPFAALGAGVGRTLRIPVRDRAWICCAADADDGVRISNTGDGPVKIAVAPYSPALYVVPDFTTGEALLPGEEMTLTNAQIGGGGYVFAIGSREVVGPNAWQPGTNYTELTLTRGA